MNQRAARANLRSRDALHHSVRPAYIAFRRDGDYRFLHGIQHGCQLLPATLNLSKTLAQLLSGLVKCRFHGGEFVALARIKPRAQISVGNAACKSHNASQTPGYAARGPGSQRQRNSQSNQPGPEHLPAQQAQCRPCRVFHHAVEDELHDHGVENKQQDE